MKKTRKADNKGTNSHVKGITREVMGQYKGYHGVKRTRKADKEGENCPKKG